MVSFKPSTFLVPLVLALLGASPSHAHITGISTSGATLHPGHSFDVKFTTENHIINNAQYYVVFGAQKPPGTTSVVGTLFGTGYDLVENGHSETGHGSFVVKVTVPDTFDTSSGKHYILTAAVFGTVRLIIPNDSCLT